MHLVVLDTETGGLDSATDALLEIGALLVDSSLEKAGELDLLIRPWPGLRVLKESLDINGLDPADLESRGLLEHEALARLRAFVSLPLTQGPVILAGWNISFDQSFLQAAFKRHNMPWPFGHRTLDIQSVWAYCHNWDFSGLTAACQSLFGSVPRHRALSDAQVTLDVLKKCPRLS